MEVLAGAVGIEDGVEEGRFEALELTVLVETREEDIVRAEDEEMRAVGEVAEEASKTIEEARIMIIDNSSLNSHLLRLRCHLEAQRKPTSTRPLRI